MAIDIIGADGVAYKQDVSNKDLKRQYDFDITIVTSGQEQAMQGVEKRNKLTFLTNNKINPLLNAQKVIESEAIIAGFNQDEVKELLSKDYGESELMSEAAQDIQTLLTKKKIKPNRAANIAYAQKILDFATDESENLKPEQLDRFFAYLDELKPIVVYNMNNSINDQLAKEGLISAQGQAM